VAQLEASGASRSTNDLHAPDPETRPPAAPYGGLYHAFARSRALHPSLNEKTIVSVPDPSSGPPRARRPRRLRPEVAAELAARNRRAEMNVLYEKPVDELDPDELARMRREFFRS
jgi:hypothetical protein